MGDVWDVQSWQPKHTLLQVIGEETGAARINPSSLKGHDEDKNQEYKARSVGLFFANIDKVVNIENNKHSKIHELTHELKRYHCYIAGLAEYKLNIISTSYLLRHG
ncbi:hypothetical protein DPMN_154161 [Dreissena polymorpha]|uniref:Uncharacterized protein n=1 Tax=Dreissena polymorpha TaxID=45954 RepID=A0A9D4FKG8_DREPO|nr:hypothetical protein DPMN_154161 [Dreissena polymorpha]